MSATRPLSSLLQGLPPAGLYLLLVAREFFRARLASALLTWAQAGTIYVIDAGYGFPGYHLARQAPVHGASLNQVLHRIRLARAFTGHQLLSLLQSRDLQGPVLLIDPPALFLDEDVHFSERRRLWFRMLARIGSLRSRFAVLVALRYPLPGASETSRMFLQPLMKDAHVIYQDPFPAPSSTPLFRASRLFQEVKHGSDASFR